VYCTRLRAHRQPPGSPGRPQSGYFDGGPLACTSYAPQALEKMGCGQHQHLSTRTRELRAGGGLVSWVAAAAAAAAAAVLGLQLAGLAAALLQLPLCPVAAGCWCGAVAAAASASAASAAAASAASASAAAASAASAASAPAAASPSSCCLSFFLLPLLHCRPPCSRCSSLHLLLIWCCWWAGKGSLSANRQQCPRTAALLGFWRFVSARLGPKRQEGK
jgi:hypothetical protein